ncbi:hypothetical protein PIB30_016887 [Stylosanthes scabra]|uniref:Uncharacterized protein n=1 Tax=Stylosanthes scabra TaxID=79078 RepID=A0ABU6V5P3_9FABA|nr:hypothetical protein [Stylosanthes scabra]
MSIEAMAMAGIDYKACGLTFEEWDDQHSRQEHAPLPPAMFLQAERNMSVNAASVESMKMKLQKWAKTVASDIEQTPVSFNVTKNEMIYNSASEFRYDLNFDTCLDERVAGLNTRPTSQAGYA